VQAGGPPSVWTQHRPLMQHVDTLFVFSLPLLPTLDHRPGLTLLGPVWIEMLLPLWIFTPGPTKLPRSGMPPRRGRSYRDPLHRVGRLPILPRVRPPLPSYRGIWVWRTPASKPCIYLSLHQPPTRGQRVSRPVAGGEEPTLRTRCWYGQAVPDPNREILGRRRRGRAPSR